MRHRLTSLTTVVGACLIGSLVNPAISRAQNPHRVKDIATGVHSSWPGVFVAFQGEVYFSAAALVTGEELWKTDGTAEGTVLVKDINTEPAWPHASPRELTVVGNTLFFRARGNATGFELWKSDGTEAGTVLVKDINPGIYSSNPSLLVNLNGSLLFYADDGVHGKELWKSDGTEEGTVLLKEIYSSPGDSTPIDTAYKVIGDRLFFGATGNGGDTELWMSDGTTEGTKRVKDINSGLAPSDPRMFVDLDGRLLFQANEPVHSYELWKSDGTESGTDLVADINPGSSPSYPSSLTVSDGRIYFKAFHPLFGYELWKSDGTADGTSMVKDIVPGAGNGLGSGVVNTYIAVAGGTVFFTANDGTTGTELWKSDGTAAGTSLLRDIVPGPSTSKIDSMVEADGVLLFRATDASGTELWRSDGTPEGTVMVQDIFPGSGSAMPLGMTTIDGVTYFGADDGTSGEELWVYRPNNHVPNAAAGPAQDVELGTIVTLDGSASTDPDGDHLRYEWRDDGVVIGTSAVITASLSVGVHTVLLTIDDGFGATATDAVVVTVRDTTEPAVAVVDPPDGAKAFTGVPLIVEWTATDNGTLAAVDVMASTDGGATFVPIAGCDGLPGSARSCTWSSPGPASPDARLKVIARDEAGNVGSATSVLVLVDPFVTVTSPNAPVVWPIGSVQTIAWAHNLGTEGTMHVALSRDGGASWIPIADAPNGPDAGSLAWIVTGPRTSHARVRVTSASIPAASDVSDTNFTINAGPSANAAPDQMAELWRLVPIPPVP